MTVKLGRFDPAVLDIDTRLALRVLWIAVLLAVLTSHLRALADFMAQRYANRRAAPSFADLVRLAHRHLILITRLPPQSSGHAAVVRCIESKEEASFTARGGS